MTAKTTTERVQALRARREASGLAEVRGIWAPLALHAQFREAAAKLLRKLERINKAKEPSK